MKKQIYLAPEIKEVRYNLERHIMSVSKEVELGEQPIEEDFEAY